MVPLYVVMVTEMDYNCALYNSDLHTSNLHVKLPNLESLLVSLPWIMPRSIIFGGLGAEPETEIPYNEQPIQIT
jgi:hypothetical protein